MPWYLIYLMENRVITNLPSRQLPFYDFFLIQGTSYFSLFVCFLFVSTQFHFIASLRHIFSHRVDVWNKYEACFREKESPNEILNKGKGKYKYIMSIRRKMFPISLGLTGDHIVVWFCIRFTNLYLLGAIWGYVRTVYLYVCFIYSLNVLFFPNWILCCVYCFA